MLFTRSFFKRPPELLTESPTSKNDKAKYPRDCRDNYAAVLDDEVVVSVIMYIAFEEVDGHHQHCGQQRVVEVVAGLANLFSRR